MQYIHECYFKPDLISDKAGPSYSTSRKQLSPEEHLGLDPDLNFLFYLQLYDVHFFFYS